jgi:hypothetical protein
MNQKQLIGLIVAGLVLGGIGFTLYNQQKGGWESAPRGSAEKLLGNFPLNDVEQISIRGATNALTLARAEDGWKVQDRGGYPANFDEIHGLLRRIWELKPVQELQVGNSHLGRLQLEDAGQGEKSGTLLEFKSKDGKSHALLLGKDHESPGGSSSPFGGSFASGRYVMVPGKLDTVSLVSETFSSATTDPNRWLDKTFFKVERIKSIAWQPHEATNAWTVERESESGEWKLADAKESEQLDTARTSSFNYLLSSPSFADVAAPDVPPADTGLDKPVLATIKTFDDFTYTVKIGNTNEDNLYLAFDVTADIPQQREAKPEEKDVDKGVLDKEFKEKKEKLEKKLADEKKLTKWTYLVTKWTVDALMKDRKDLLKAEEKKEEESTAPDGPPIPFALPKEPGE